MPGPRLESTPLGSTGRDESRLGFGGAPAGLTGYLGQYSPHEKDQRQQVIAAIQHARSSGITYFDTAAAYGQGESEKIFGEALGGDTPGIFLATKLGNREADVRGSLERSLRNLRVDRVDLVQVHGGSYTDAEEDAVMQPGGVLDTLEKAREEGLLGHIGFTSEDQNASVYRFIRSGRFDVMQVQYNLLFQHPYSPDRPFGSMIEAENAHMGIVTMRGLTSGVFQNWMSTVRPHDAFDYSAALLQFVLSNPLVDVALVGMRTPVEVDRNIAVLQDASGRVDLDGLHEKYV